MSAIHKLRGEALTASVFEHERLEDLNKRGVATARPDKERGWVIRVVDYTLTERLVLHLEDWADFQPNAAGHRLIERGWMTYGFAHFVPERPAGWFCHPDGQWTAPVHALDESGT